MCTIVHARDSVLRVILSESLVKKGQTNRSRDVVHNDPTGVEGVDVLLVNRRVGVSSRHSDFTLLSTLPPNVFYSHPDKETSLVEIVSTNLHWCLETTSRTWVFGPEVSSEKTTRSRRGRVEDNPLESNVVKTFV